mmetsp:Transcript_2063/g.2606  ORF Transcript_2063/g.2606 Transcript_2063/m.2606 type:complete len:157 (-) Transcript_2063:587-1057(-)
MFDNDKIKARIIIDCGHNMCECCIREYCVRGQLYCPQCKKSFPPRRMNDYPPNIAIRSLKNDTSLKSILVKRVPGDLGKKPAGEIFKTSSEESKSNEDNSCQGYNSDLEINYDQLQADCEDDYDALSLNLDEEVQNFEVHKEAIPALSLPDVEMAK